MAYDQTLADRVADYLAEEPTLSDKKMFGGLAFLIDGNMAVGISGDSLMVRVGADKYEAALAEPGVEVFGKTGREMKGWVFVKPSLIADQAGLGSWIDRGRSIAKSLPPK